MLNKAYRQLIAAGGFAILALKWVSEGNTIGAVLATVATLGYTIEALRRLAGDLDD